MTSDPKSLMMTQSSLCSHPAGAAARDPRWPVDRAYRVHVRITPPPKSVGYPVPVRISIPFHSLLRESGVNHSLDPHSIVVVGDQGDVSHLLDDSLQYRDGGWIAWLLRRHRKQADFYIYFDTVAGSHATEPQSRYIAPLGFGDNLRYNRPNGLTPIQAMGVQPISADFDGDGRVDLISRCFYGDAWGQPGFSVLFWRNIGSNARPVYADFVRLSCNGQPIANHYSGCDLYDWDRDGQLELVTSTHVYHKTGEINPWGAPVLEELGKVPAAGISGRPYLYMLGMRDYLGNGTDGLFFVRLDVHYTYEGPPNHNYVSTGLYFKRNQASATHAPRFTSVTQSLPLDGQETSENCIISDFLDVNGDGKPDVVGTTNPLNKTPAVPCFCYWRNQGNDADHPEYSAPHLISGGENLSSASLVGVHNAAYSGMFATEGYRVRYYAGKAPPDPQRPMLGYKDEGLLMQQNGRCAVDGFSGVDVVDWNGDGKWDFVVGDEFGQIWLMKNIGSRKRPVFASAVRLEAAGKPMRVMRQQYVQDGNPEHFLGQTKPRCVDWDGDGDLDILVGNNTNRLVYFENIGTRAKPAFAEPRVIQVDGSDEAFGWRCQPAIYDVDGDGLLDLITVDRDGRLSLYQRVREHGILKLLPGRPLLHVDGAPITDAVNPCVCDWDGDGKWDIIAQTGTFGSAGPVFFRNVGTNTDPQFAQPVRLKCWDTPISVSSHEQTFAAVDWDGTGRLDLICGGESGLLYFFRRSVLDMPSGPAAQVVGGIECRG